MGTDSFNLHIYMNITEDTERRFVLQIRKVKDNYPEKK